ncbi:hypothetical protein DRW03_32605 [Corallococcus sp. H22C18031201]|uniref:hypothetical protein n=1 Tax=Citreicoccus inhibens TaxID=2849499 RepID=UPI000E744A7E|nr:hypothetical protein [Citreicoccus inhibens]MBU8897977.1 GatB/YqeY domain-containing protein [Citreicoccus inhibens]RJS15820.1 hypothetical protein DRW03_32605 [Corallococcus sp. H22C18031201]
MRTVEEWKATLRTSIKTALRNRDTHGVAVLRETLAAIDNAEAPDLSHAPATVLGEVAGTSGGLGSGEVPRLLLSPEEVHALVQREIQERRDAAEQLASLGKHAEAQVLRAKVDVLLAL